MPAPPDASGQRGGLEMTVDTWVLPAHWQCVEFLSDLHLQQASARTFHALEAHLRHTSADAVLILGDLFEAWVGDDAGDSGFEAQCLDMLAEAASRRCIGFMAGNRDFLLGEATLSRCRLRRLNDPTVLTAFGTRCLVTHGDALCLDDHAYQAFRREVRAPAWQQAFLARPLADRQALAQQMRQASQLHQKEQRVEGYGDIDLSEASRWSEAAQAAFMIHGHTHRPSHEALSASFERFVLSDWDYDSAPDRARGDVLQWHRGGVERIAPLGLPASSN